MIIDCHVHILNAGETHLAWLLRAADRAGVERLCISSLGREWVEFPSEEGLEEAAADVLVACDRYDDRFIGFTYVSADHVEKSLELLERCIVHGPCRGVKFWVSQFADDPRLDPIIDRAVELDVPILAHTWMKATGNMTCESTCHHVRTMARRHPRVKVWLAHYSGRWEEVARIIQDTPNVCVDVAGGEPEDGIVECLLERIPADRIFYGSDAPGRGFAVQMAKVLGADIPDADKDNILGENVRRWIRV